MPYHIITNPDTSNRIIFYINPNIEIGHAYKETCGDYVFRFNENLTGHWSAEILQEIAKELFNVNKNI